MPTKLEPLIEVRSRLADELVAYLQVLADFGDRVVSPLLGQQYLPWREGHGSCPLRAVILGDPGSGKTRLLLEEARRLSLVAIDELCKRDVSVAGIRLPIYARVPELGESNEPLEELLANLAARDRSGQFRNLVRAKLETGLCVVLLDAWDEVALPESHVRHRLSMFSRGLPHTRILLASRVVATDFDELLAPDPQRYEVPALTRRQIESYIRATCSQDSQAITSLLEMFEVHDDLHELAGNARLLAVMCNTGRTHRAEQYKACLAKMLRRGHGSVADMQTLLQATAWRHLVNDEAWHFSRSFLHSTVARRLEAMGLNDSAEDSVRHILQTGIIKFVSVHSEAMSFLHPRIRDYLAAGELAKQLGGPQGEQRILDLPEGRLSANELLDAKTQDPRWAEVIVFLAGQLPASQALGLVEQIADIGPSALRGSRDAGERRLLLAARCMGEIRTECGCADDCSGYGP